jgi:hypothetical protein
MPMALQTQRNGKVKISEENAWSIWCPTPRKAERPTQTIRHACIITLEKLGFEEEKGQLREWMTVARDRSFFGR